MDRVNWVLKSALIKKFGSQVEAARQMGIREAKLSYIVRGHAEPSSRERRLLRNALGRKVTETLSFRPTRGIGE